MDVEQSAFRFEIVDVVEWQLTNGEPAFVIFLNITNLDQKARLITLSQLTYITSGGEQLERNLWISGYFIEHGRIKGNAHRKSGLAFYKSYLHRISRGDSLYVEVEVPDRRMKLSLRFEKSASQGNMPWALCDADIDEFDLKPTPRVVSRALTKGIERLEVFEERFGIVLDKLSVNASDDYRFLTVAGEIHLAGSGSLAKDITLVAVAYDSEGCVMETGQSSISAEGFSGFDVFSLTLCATDIGLLARRIRVFPKAD
jgi:hypothetical protein